MKRLSLPFAVCLLFATAAAHADPVTYYFENTSLQGGGSISGSFTYNADSNQTTNVDFSTGFGELYPGATYTTVYHTINIPLSSTVFAFDTGNVNAGSPYVLLYTPTPLTDAGGTFSFNLREFDCTENDCGNQIQVRTGSGTITSNSTLTAPTPEPSSIILLAFGLAGVLYVHTGYRGKRSRPSESYVR